MNDRFKVWDNEKKEWLHAGYLQDIFCNNDGKLFFKHCEYIKELDLKRYKKLNCTGLKDKNGKLIWEGDILYNPNDKFNYEIIYDEKNAGFSLGKEGCGLEKFRVMDFWEIIGNRFENKNLIDNK